MFRSVPCSSHFPEIGGQSGCRHSRCRSLPRWHHRHWADKGGTPRKPATRSRGSRQLRSEATTGQVCFLRSKSVVPGVNRLEGRTACVWWECPGDTTVYHKQFEFRGQAQLLREVSARICICLRLINTLSAKDGDLRLSAFNACLPWKWSTECVVAFDQLKQMLADKTRLVHFDPEKPIVLATDASPYGIGAAISHVLPDGSEEPIAFASKTQQGRTRLCPSREGGTVHRLRYPEVQPIPKWSSLHHPDRPQATTNDIWTG